MVLIRMRLERFLLFLGLIAFLGCISVGSLGLITKSSADPVSVVAKSHSMKELGPTQGTACRYFALGVAPFGNSDIQTAVDKALTPSGGDALVNVTTSTSLYGFFPIYDVFSFTCTTVKGTALKF